MIFTIFGIMLILCYICLSALCKRQDIALKTYETIYFYQWNDKISENLNADVCIYCWGTDWNLPMSFNWHGTPHYNWFGKDFWLYFRQQTLYNVWGMCVCMCMCLWECVCVWVCVRVCVCVHLPELYNKFDLELYNVWPWVI